jgi:hypothetical protein
VKVVLLFALLLQSFLLGYFLDDITMKKPKEAELKTIKMVLSLKNNSSIPMESEDVLVFLPGLDSPPVNVKINDDHLFRVGKEHNNARLIIAQKNIPPYYKSEVLITADIMQTQVAYPSSVFNPQSISLKAIPNRVRLISREIQANTSKSYPQLVAEWIPFNIEHEQYNRNTQSVDRTLKTRKGDCTDVAELAKQLLASMNIPAFVVGGFIVTNSSAIVAARDYHNWIYYLEDDLWKIMDPSKGIIDTNYSDYIAFDVSPNIQNYTRFSTTNHNLELLLK